MLESSYFDQHVIADPEPRFATDAEIALAERLRQKIEERYLGTRSDNAIKANVTPKAETGPSGPFHHRKLGASRRAFARTYTEKLDPHPQVVCAFGFLITNCAPSRPSW